jgi:ribonuclease HI
MESLVYVGFTDGASHHTWNLAFTSWVIYSPEGLSVSLGGVCLGPSTNNVAEYNTIIELLRDAISHGIRSIEVHLDSQLVIRQLNGRYHVRDPTVTLSFPTGTSFRMTI